MSELNNYIIIYQKIILLNTLDISVVNDVLLKKDTF